MEEEKRGKFLRELRLSKKMTQHELGEILHYSSKAISKWERGIAFPHNPSTLEKLSELFDVSELELLYGERKTEQNANKINNNMTTIYKKNYKKLTLAIIITILLTSLVIFLSCFSFYTYFIKGKIRSYILHGENETFAVKTSSILLTNDKNIFHFSGVEAKEGIPIDHIKLFYYDTETEKENLILSGANESYYFAIPKGYKEINLEKVVTSKIYIEIWYKGTKRERIELQIEEEYKNEDLFIPKQEPATIETDVTENKEFIEFLIKEGFSYNENGFAKQEGDVIIVYNELDSFIIKKATNNKIEVLSCSLKFNQALYFLTAKEQKITEKIPLEGDYNPMENKENFKSYYIKYLNYLKQNFEIRQQ